LLDVIEARRAQRHSAGRPWLSGETERSLAGDAGSFSEFPTQSRHEFRCITVRLLSHKPQVSRLRPVFSLAAPSPLRVRSTDQNRNSSCLNRLLSLGAARLEFSGFS
jgi:hypothetical protein